jgi:hypothetical protein
VEEYKTRNAEANYRFYPVMGLQYTLELLDGTHAPNFVAQARNSGPEYDEDDFLGPRTAEQRPHLGLEPPTLGTLRAITSWVDEMDQQASETQYYTPTTTI